jgi:hypothetical protein
MLYPWPSDGGVMWAGDVAVQPHEHTHPADRTGTMRSSCPACQRVMQAAEPQMYGSAIASLLPYLKQELALPDDDLSELSADQVRMRIDHAVTRWINAVQDPHQGDRRPFK